MTPWEKLGIVTAALSTLGPVAGMAWKLAKALANFQVAIERLTATQESQAKALEELREVIMPAPRKRQR
jgi:hypothetical protein